MNGKAIHQNSLWAGLGSTSSALTNLVPCSVGSRVIRRNSRRCRRTPRLRAEDRFALVAWAARPPPLLVESDADAPASGPFRRLIIRRRLVGQQVALLSRSVHGTPGPCALPGLGHPTERAWPGTRKHPRRSGSPVWA